MSCQLLAPQTVPCSGAGSCVKNGPGVVVVTSPVATTNTSAEYVCVCKPGYTSIGDFAPIPGQDCDIHLLAIRVLWGIAMIPAILNILLCVRYFYLKWKHEQAQKEEEMGSKKKPVPTSATKELIVLVPISALFFCISVVVLAGIKIYNPELGVGTNLATTIVFGCVFKGFWTAQTIFIYYFILLTSKQAKIKAQKFQENLKRQLLFFKRFVVFFSMADFIWGFIPLYILSHPDMATTIGAVHYLCACFNIVMIGGYVLPRVVKSLRDDIREVLGIQRAPQRSPIKEQQEHLERLRETMEKAEKKLTAFLNFLCQNVPQQFALAFIIGLWPFMLRKTSYQLPITYIIGLFIVMNEILSVSNFTSSSHGKTDTGRADMSQNSSVVKPVNSPMNQITVTRTPSQNDATTS